jgi:hypothetical protein
VSGQKEYIWVPGYVKGKGGWIIETIKLRNIAARGQAEVFVARSTAVDWKGATFDRVVRYYGENDQGIKFAKDLVPSASAYRSYGYPIDEHNNCFVATAAFQNQDHPMVQELRHVRDEILARSSPGRRFIAWYYRNGPAIADVVRPRPYLRAASRAVLTPIALAARANRRLRNYWKGPQ